MLNRDKLQKILHNHESIDVFDLSTLMDMNVDELLCGINELMDEFSTWFKRTAWKIHLFKKDETEVYFSIQIVDVGFLCQHVIKEFKTTIKKKHAKLVYIAYKNMWLLNRGY